MATTNIEAIATDITSEQMSKACRVIDFQTGEDFYQVESSTGECDYEVRYDAEMHLRSWQAWVPQLQELLLACTSGGGLLR